MSEAASPSPFPWDEVLALLLGRLRWRPEDVWRATPREVAAALGGGGSPMRRSELRALMARFPDK
ncbi:rcc01693 family protein [Enterovirga sp.]|uniref:rcc01693 family protein n=1 Tax=Enterovirga sp. TaxID=2026350 RepID=UPI002BBBFBBF|nr:rcc01693 family protein [Enterovirga sp.]HMO29748.1 phage tail assembly chaperone [Enterovirga sp.]